MSRLWCRNIVRNHDDVTYDRELLLKESLCTHAYSCIVTLECTYSKDTVKRRKIRPTARTWQCSAICTFSAVVGLSHLCCSRVVLCGEAYLSSCSEAYLKLKETLSRGPCGCLWLPDTSLSTYTVTSSCIWTTPIAMWKPLCSLLISPRA